MPLNQVSCELDPRPPKVAALQGGRRLELARWSSEDVLPHLPCPTQPPPSRVLPTGARLCMAARVPPWLTLSAGSHWPLSHTVDGLTLLGARRHWRYRQETGGHANRDAERQADRQTH